MKNISNIQLTPVFVNHRPKRSLRWTHSILNPTFFDYKADTILCDVYEYQYDKTNPGSVKDGLEYLMRNCHVGLAGNQWEMRAPPTRPADIDTNIRHALNQPYLFGYHDYESVADTGRTPLNEPTCIDTHNNMVIYRGMYPPSELGNMLGNRFNDTMPVSMTPN